MLTNLKQLISNPDGHLSTSDTMLCGAFIASTAVLLCSAWQGNLDEWLYIGYLTAWVINTQASKQASIKRHREVGLDD
ncbi:hypothetical protein LU631_12765 [Erwinia tracheiphila]|uniref:Uncharacterized protein n=1 Tax=Erwinia tracheiphila TaxID=65700 RepID=A0A0M2K3Z7_9GAMM|nr:hypothetical protein [Erwinia tracheiphila]AXF76832.1 hypothetical protein AV903_13530 [Erwinia tracheiphila]AXF78647.1 hypothetical protein AV903_25895 [Erwinia tracheiphila]EOS94165.1 hypothetical protein ETR_15191 [Erwinia tracheiphila PSU-1]KKF34115.1 hypothetical protein SY86_24075 [Erwinia tracheiphila]KKF35725.1 hypothetical protein SY86_10295 [Erwinia tracheiphila]